VAPPDAVAATTIARRVGMPRRIVSLLEGESLVNDATALVCLTAAVAAIEGQVTAGGVAGDFAVSVIGGTVAGLLVAVAVSKAKLHINDIVTQTAVSLATPFAAYLLAEEAHASGVLAVVVTGLILGHKSTRLQSAAARLFERSNWATIGFLLEGAVFVIIGLKVRPIVEAVADSPLARSTIAVAVVATLAATIAVRFAWVFAFTWLRRRGDAEPVPWRAATVVSWAGMRGVVTLAAAFVLPESTPHREVLLLVALTAAAGTLLLQGATLPAVIRWSGMPVPDRHEDILQAAGVLHRAALAGEGRLAELAAAEPDLDVEVLGRLRARSFDRADAMWERLGGATETPAQAYSRLRSSMLEAERAEVLRIRDGGAVDHEVIQEVLTALDVEESVLELVVAGSTADREADLAVPEREAPGCLHLAAPGPDPRPGTPDGCEECLRDGTTWVHLRLCLACGHVGCCDSSPHRHATAHFHEGGHPVIRSFEPGEAWRWCYVDELLG
jgi:CPA1 family monovalent cation:H+ antiporter